MIIMAVYGQFVERNFTPPQASSDKLPEQTAESV